MAVTFHRVNQPLKYEYVLSMDKKERKIAFVLPTTQFEGVGLNDGRFNGKWKCKKVIKC